MSLATLSPTRQLTNKKQRKEKTTHLGSASRFDIWVIVALLLLVGFCIFLVIPLTGVLKNSVSTPDGSAFTLEYFKKFFASDYYLGTIWNSLKVSVAVTIACLIIGTPFSYFYTFYRLKGARLLFICAVLSCMSAPFIGAYAWILLMGRNGVLTQFFTNTLGIKVGSIYGFAGILLVLSLKFFPLVSVYMNGAFKSIDASLLEAAENLGASPLRRFRSVTVMLTMPTILAAALLVFMRTFADFGTPLLIGEGYRTFTVEIYNQYLGEVGQDHNFAAAISIIAILVTAAVFFLQKWVTSKFNFSINALHPIEKKKPRGIAGVGMYAYCYILVGLSFLPQVYIVYLSFKKATNSVFKPGFSLDSYKVAATRLLGRSLWNTLFFGFASLAIIIVLSVLIAYLVVRRSGVLANTIDTISMLPYIMPGAVIGIALVLAFNHGPIVLAGTAAIMILALVIRRMPYTIRSATATLMHIPMSVEEASRNLGASKMKTFWKITVPMMSSGIISGAILSFVSIVTEMSAGIILYNNKTITLTMSAYVAITRGNYGVACAFSAILTFLTAAILLAYLLISKDDDIKM